MRAHFEEHLEKLQRESIFAAWGHVEADDDKEADVVLGAGFKKADAWLELNLFIVLTPQGVDPTG